MFRPQYNPLLSGLALSIALGACSSSPAPAYRAESFEADTPFQFHSELPPLLLCENGKRALLSQGYEVDASSPLNIRGSKFFQPQAELQVQLRITLVCVPTGKDSTVYANALQTRYELKSSGSSTGLSVTGIGSISVPWPTDKGSLVKVGEETISDAGFYHRLFVLIETLQH
ncbi:hypothetical protein AT959_18420 [Dechloromonas denitrificans]|uniref:DUF2242 domain-containing protein n=1 Tax=Dechloromonas denitrificans TaxID=281362 RepID=A0A133XE03_9RHOO|nr:DUF2242 domain-containing protein [Dechloromonas denitrificans]KXB29163.1 hypothetical protein AT959_18420 [Dechloromonas denitrificans]